MVGPTFGKIANRLLQGQLSPVRGRYDGKVEAAWESSPGMTMSTVGKTLVDSPTRVLAVMSSSSNGC